MLLAVSGVTTMRSMFQSAASFSKDLSSWAVSQVQDMRDMFKGASSFNQALCWYLAHYQDDDFAYDFNGPYGYYQSFPIEDNTEGMFDSAGPSASLNENCLPCIAGEYRTGPNTCSPCPAGSFAPEHARDATEGYRRAYRQLAMKVEGHASNYKKFPTDELRKELADLRQQSAKNVAFSSFFSSN